MSSTTALPPAAASQPERTGLLLVRNRETDGFCYVSIASSMNVLTCKIFVGEEGEELRELEQTRPPISLSDGGSISIFTDTIRLFGYVPLLAGVHEAPRDVEMILPDGYNCEIEIVPMRRYAIIENGSRVRITPRST